MAKNVQHALQIMLICMLASASLIAADVKLRIYLQDGTLQSGNLVTETNDSFVVLTRDGRAEVPKAKIMFINGKTLQQWQERPDKLFQTEILPSEIPDPSYVNDKTALPTMPGAVKPVARSRPTAPIASDHDSASRSTADPVKPKISAAATPAKSLQPAKISQQVAVPAIPSKKTTAPIEKSAPANVAAVAPVTTKTTAAPVPVKEIAPARAERRHRHHTTAAVNPAPAASLEKPATAPSAPAAHPTRSQKPASVPLAAPQPAAGNAPASPAPENLPAHFVRNEYAAYYYQQALQQLSRNEKGPAINSLHLAAVLNRQDPEPTLLLGKVYMEQGLLGRAQKLLSHPILKKRADANTLLAQVADLQKAKKMRKRVLYGSTGAGAFAWIPLVLLLRRARRAPRHVITAESAIASPFPDKNNIEKVLEELIESTPAPQPGFVRIASVEPVRAPAPMETRIEPAPVPSRPVTLPLSMPMGMPAPIIPLPMATKQIEAPLPPPEISIPAAPLVAASPEVPASVRFAPAAASALPDVDAMLRLASMVEQAVRKGNALAMDEKFDQARRDYRTALALNPSCLEAQLGLAYICFSQGQMDLAFEHYVRSLKIDPASADGHYGVGQVLLETGRVEEAVLEFQQTLVLDPTFDDARETLTSLGAVA